MKMNVMKQFLGAFDDGKLASGGDGVNGVALPKASDFMDTSNTTVQALSTMVSLCNMSTVAYSDCDTHLISSNMAVQHYDWKQSCILHFVLILNKLKEKRINTVKYRR